MTKSLKSSFDIALSFCTIVPLLPVVHHFVQGLEQSRHHYSSVQKSSSGALNENLKAQEDEEKNLEITNSLVAPRRYRENMLPKQSSSASYYSGSALTSYSIYQI